MNTWTNAVITNQGMALQAKLIAGTSLTITRAVTGSGYVNPTLLAQQTAVSNIQQTLTFRTISYPETGKVCVPTVLDNDELTTGYTAMQVGFYATDPDEGEILYFIAQADSGAGIPIPSETEMASFTAEWDFYFQYGQADNVNVTVDPAGAVSRTEAQQLIDTAVDPVQDALDDHEADTNNPHSVTAAQVGLGNVDNIATALAWTASGSLSTYKRIYLDPSGSDDNAGTTQAPMATIIGAIQKYAQTCKWLDIYMNDGTYTQDIGTIAFDACDIAIRSTSQNKDNVTLNITEQIDVMVGSVRLYNMTINMQTNNTRAISVDNGSLFCYNCRINVPTASTASCVNVYNAAMAWLYNCVLNSGTGSSSGACAYGNQAMIIKAINCTTERTVAFGFFATNGTTIEYTPTVTATTMTKETNGGRCYVPDIYLPISGGTLTGNLTIDPSIASPPALSLTAEAAGSQTASTRISKNATASSDLGTYIRDYAAGGVESNNYVQLQIRKSSGNLKTRLQLIDTNNGTPTVYGIYGDFNKPAAVVEGTTEPDS